MALRANIDQQFMKIGESTISFLVKNSMGKSTPSYQVWLWSPDFILENQSLSTSNESMSNVLC